MEYGRSYFACDDRSVGIEPRVPGEHYGSFWGDGRVGDGIPDGCTASGDGGVQSVDGNAEPAECGERERDERDSASDIPVAAVEFSERLDECDRDSLGDHECVGYGCDFPGQELGHEQHTQRLEFIGYADDPAFGSFGYAGVQSDECGKGRLEHDDGGADEWDGAVHVQL